MLTLTTQLTSLKSSETVGGNNYTNWEDEEYQKLLSDSRSELDPDKRQELLKEAEELFMDEMVVSPVYFYTNVYAHKDYVHDIKVGALGVIQFKWGYITEE